MGFFGRRLKILQIPTIDTRCRVRNLRRSLLGGCYQVIDSEGFSSSAKKKNDASCQEAM